MEVDHPWVREYFHGPRARARQSCERGARLMETRANFILIGAFTLLAILGTLGFFCLARQRADRPAICHLRHPVSTMCRASIRPATCCSTGISVGQVIGLGIYRTDPSKVLPRSRSTPPLRCAANTVAQLQSQGVTGSPIFRCRAARRSRAADGADGGAADHPLAPVDRSGAGRGCARSCGRRRRACCKQFQALTGPENQAYVTRILRNLDASSARLDQALTDFSDITGTVSDATTQITRFTGRLDTIGASVETTLGQRQRSPCQSAQRAFDSAGATLATSDTAIKSVEATFTQAETLLRDRIPDILDGISATVAQTETAIADLQKRSGDTLDGFGETAGLLNARLTELEQTLTEANTAFVSVTTASDGFDQLVNGDGTLLVSEARAVLSDAKNAISTIEAVVLNDVPAVMTDIRRAVGAATTAVDQVASDVTGLTGRFDPLAQETEQALASANALFEKAQGSLGALDTTLGTAQGALGSAQTAFDTANEVLQIDLGPVLSDIRTASDRISVAVEDVTRDVPAIAAELRALISRADAVVGQVQQAVAASAPGIREFSSTGLPELTRLSAEARTLVTTLNSLVRRIERDPARFLLDERVPEYRK